LARLELALLAAAACFTFVGAAIVLRQYYAENHSFAFDWRISFDRAMALRHGQAPYFVNGADIYIVTPHFVALASSLLVLGPNLSSVAWALMSLVMLFLSCGMVMSSIAWNPSSLTRIGVGWFLAVSVPAALLVVAYAQETAPVVLSYAAGIWLLSRKRDTWAGATLAIGLLIKPQLTFLCLPILVYKKRWAALCGYLAAAAAGTVLTVLVVGVDTFREYVTTQRTFSQWITQNPGTRFENLGVDDLFHYEIPSVISPEVSADLLRILLIGMLALYWRGAPRADALDTGRRWAVTVLVTVLVTPYCHYYDAVLLMIPGVVLAAEAASARDRSSAKFYAYLLGVVCSYIGPEARMLYSVHITALTLLAALVVLTTLPRIHGAPIVAHWSLPVAGTQCYLPEL
jgi:hypothetical protein